MPFKIAYCCNRDKLYFVNNHILIFDLLLVRRNKLKYFFIVLLMFGRRTLRGDGIRPTRTGCPGAFNRAGTRTDVQFRIGNEGTSGIFEYVTHWQSSGIIKLWAHSRCVRLEQQGCTHILAKQLFSTCFCISKNSVSRPSLIELFSS